jgi:hypothetical protein
MPRGKIIRPQDAQMNLSTITGLKTFCPGRKVFSAGDLGVLALKKRLDVEILHIESVVLNELATSFDVLSHQGGEDGLSLCNIFKLD